MSFQLITIAVFGASGSRKTRFINDAINVGNLNLDSLDTQAGITGTAFQLDGKDIILFDVPEFDEDATAFLTEAYQAGFKLNGIIYLVDDSLSHHTLNVFHRLCGDEALANVVFVTDPSTHQAVGLGPLMDKGAAVGQSTHEVIRALSRKEPVSLAIQKEMVDRGMEILETSAWKLNSEGQDDLGELEQRFKERSVYWHKEVRETLGWEPSTRDTWSLELEDSTTDDLRRKELALKKVTTEAGRKCIIA